MNSRLGAPSPAAAHALLALNLILAAPPGTAVAEAGKRPLLLAHYMPWFTAKPRAPAWGWHWTMNTFDPEHKQGGKRRIASHYYPLIGPYDSGDPAVIEYHLLLMKLAGIDGLVVDWYGRTNHLDYPAIHRNTAGLFRPAARFGLRIAVCYEDQTIPQLVRAGILLAAGRVGHAREEIDWLRQNWFREPAYVTLGGKPLLLSFGRDGLTDREWEQVLADKGDAPVYLSEHRRRGAAAGTFDWPVPKEHPASLERYYEQVKDRPVAMPVAFPRFHDIYGEAKVRPSWGRIADDEGRTLVTTLRRALRSGAPLVQIATWNDWGEGTAVEPSAEFGYRDLEAVQRLRREVIDPDFEFGPEDLRLPHRLWVLRGKQAREPSLKDALDTIAQRLAHGSLSEARAVLQRVEAGSQ
jgi:hypothetical protein